jgi:hypothetical protein
VSIWFSVEVLDGASSATLWSEAFADVLVETALQQGALDWSWHRHSWGSVFEVCFEDESQWDTYRLLPAVQVALDAVPDPVTGLILYRGRGGSSSSGFPRRPRPLVGSGSAALPIPWEPGPEDFSSVWSLIGTSPRQPALANRLTATSPRD